MLDRYKSLQRRNIIEPRVRQMQVRKYKRKVYTKRSHQEPVGVHVGNRYSSDATKIDLWIWMTMRIINDIKWNSVRQTKFTST